MSTAEHESGSNCFRCGYSLIGIGDDQPCPECGLLAARSRQATDELHLTRPRWLRRMALGIRLILFAVLWPVFWGVCSSTLLLMLAQLPAARMASWTFYSPYSVIRGSPAGTPFYAQIVSYLFRVPQAGLVIGALALIAGCACFARPEGFAAADRNDRWRRICLLIGSIVPTVALLFWLWNATRQSIFFQSDMLPAGLAAFLATIGCLPLPVFLFFQLRSVAKRARIAQLAEHCAIAGVGVSASLLCTAGVYAASRYPADFGLSAHWLSQGNASLLLLATLMAIALLFYFWGLLLLIQFSLAFRRAARQLAAQWKRDDRAQA